MKTAIIDLLSKKAGRDVTTPFGSEWLCHDIESITGETLSVNTVKRLTGVLSRPGGDDELHASRTTLDIIARYLGHADFPSLRDLIMEGSSHFKQAEGLVEIEMLPANTRLNIHWNPGRRITLRRLETGECLVEKAENSKLAPGDRLKLRQVMAGYPLIVKEVERDGRSLGPYTAAAEHGVTRVEIIE